jgi:hypothetical protein
VRYTFSLNKFCFLSFFPFLSQLRFQRSVFVIVLLPLFKKDSKILSLLVD